MVKTQCALTDDVPHSGCAAHLLFMKLKTAATSINQSPPQCVPLVRHSVRVASRLLLLLLLPEERLRAHTHIQQAAADYMFEMSFIGFFFYL